MDDETLKRATPRPWRGGPYPGHVESSNRLIAGCNGHQNNVRPTDAENHANAVLIVAAVNQFEALRTVAKLASDAATILLNPLATLRESQTLAGRLSQALSKLAEVERGLCARCGKSHD